MWKVFHQRYISTKPFLGKELDGRGSAFQNFTTLQGGAQMHFALHAGHRFNGGGHVRRARTA